MYSVDEIKELLRAFDCSKATRLELKGGNGEALTIIQKKGKTQIVEASAMPAAAQTVTEKLPAAPFIHEEEKQENEGSPVSSPMVGVFYSAPTPDSEPYVGVGSKVEKGDVLCLVEAMKLMNEVTAEQSGEITAVCVENGQVVEYGQTLFMIK